MKNSKALMIFVLSLLFLSVLSMSANAAETYVFVTKWGGSGSDPGQFNRPVDVAVDASGNVYVADRGNARIQKFNKIFEIEREVIPLVPIRAPIR